jgi:hypothetical protein
MDDVELKLLLFGAGITIAFLGMRIYLDWDYKIIKFTTGHRK